jgi:hypothetical protein
MTPIEELIEWVETRDMRTYQNKYAFKQAILTKLKQSLGKEKQIFIDKFALGMQKEFDIFYKIATKKKI